MRIISLLPSATEIIAGLGLTDQLVGVSHSCDSPNSVIKLPKVTSCRIPENISSQAIDDFVRSFASSPQALYDLDIALMEVLQPDLVVSQAICDVCAVDGKVADLAVRELSSRPELINLEPFSLDDILETITQLGSVTGREEQAASLVTNFKLRIERVKENSKSRRGPPPRVIFLDWLIPPFVGGHWVPEMLSLAGFGPTLITPGMPSRRASWEEIMTCDPDIIIVACCGLIESEARRDIELLHSKDRWFKLRAVREGNVHVLDGKQLFSRASPRIIDSLEQLAQILN